MAERPPQEEIDRWSKWFAVECNNRAWELTSKPDRTDREDREMLLRAYASAFHWSEVGTDTHVARADVTLAHAHSLLGHGDLALHYARRALAFFEASGDADWDIAFAHLEMALAAHAAGDAALHAKHHALAREKGAAIDEEGDREVFLEEMKRIPAPA